MNEIVIQEMKNVAEDMMLNHNNKWEVIFEHSSHYDKPHTSYMDVLRIYGYEVIVTYDDTDTMYIWDTKLQKDFCKHINMSGSDPDDEYFIYAKVHCVYDIAFDYGKLAHDVEILGDDIILCK